MRFNGFDMEVVLVAAVGHYSPRHQGAAESHGDAAEHAVECAKFHNATAVVAAFLAPVQGALSIRTTVAEDNQRDVLVLGVF